MNSNASEVEITSFVAETEHGTVKLCRITPTDGGFYVRIGIDVEFVNTRTQALELLRQRAGV